MLVPQVVRLGLSALTSFGYRNNTQVKCAAVTSNAGRMTLAGCVSLSLMMSVVFPAKAIANAHQQALQSELAYAIGLAHAQQLRQLSADVKRDSALDVRISLAQSILESKPKASPKLKFDDVPSTPFLTQESHQPNHESHQSTHESNPQ